MYELKKVGGEYSRYKEVILSHVKNKIYAYERYGIEFSALLIYSDEPIEISICRDKIRQSDQIYKIEENLHLVVYDVIDPVNAMKAAQHLLFHYHKYYLRQDVCIALATAGKDDTASDIASRLFTILEYALKRSCSNSVHDITQIDL